MKRLGFFIFIAGIGVFFMAVQEVRLSSKAKAEPNNITCGELAKNGPGDNVHVRLSDFVFYDPAAVIVTSKRSKRWKHAWLPAVPVDGAWMKSIQAKMLAGKFDPDTAPPPTGVIVLVKTSNVHNEDEMIAFLDSESLTGMVINDISSIDSKERREIETELPGANLRTAYILECGRTPAGGGKITGMFAGGAALCGLPLVLLVRGRKNAPVA